MCLGLATTGVTAAGMAAFMGAYNSITKGLPSPERIAELAQSGPQTTRIYDRTGQHLLYEVIPSEGGDRTIVPLGDIPTSMQQATIALEDKTFYTNPGGINLEGIARAFWNNLNGLPVQGGSSIAAQLVRNVTMTLKERSAQSYERKIKEAILSIELTQRYPSHEGRERILEWYLNTVFYGNNASGVEAAAKVYFGKHAKDLTLAESAMLANIPQYPSKNPIDSPEEAKQRQGLALQAMVREGYITPQQAEEAYKAELPKPPPREGLQIHAPHFVMYVLKALEERYGKSAVYGGGLTVITSLDLDLQNAVQEIVTNTVRSWPAYANAHNAAAVVIRPSSGEILAMVGSADYFDASIDGECNMAVEPRQPGSSFKPYTYAAAFEQGFNPAAMVEDKRTVFNIPGSAPYVPQNFDGGYHGTVPLRQALACSLNIPAVLLLNRIGVDSAVNMAHRMGITTIRDPGRIGLAVTLGSCEIPLVDHTYGFSVFANHGVMAGMPAPPQRLEPGFRELDPACLLQVTDGQGQMVDEFLGPQLRQVISPQVAYQVWSVLSDNKARTPIFGAGNAMVTSRPAAAKTGTSNENWDCLCMGFNPQVAVGVWVGNADHSAMSAWYGSNSAAPIWNQIMERCYASLAPVDYAEPTGVKWVNVDLQTGALPGSGGRAVRDVLADGWEPVSNHKVPMDIAICKLSGRLATPNCPPDEVEHRFYDLYPTANGQWVRSIKDPQPPSTWCDVHQAPQP